MIGKSVLGSFVSGESLLVIILVRKVVLMDGVVNKLFITDEILIIDECSLVEFVVNEYLLMGFILEISVLTEGLNDEYVFMTLVIDECLVVVLGCTADEVVVMGLVTVEFVLKNAADVTSVLIGLVELELTELFIDE